VRLCAPALAGKSTALALFAASAAGGAVPAAGGALAPEPARVRVALFRHQGQLLSDLLDHAVLPPPACPPAWRPPARPPRCPRALARARRGLTPALQAAEMALAAPPGAPGAATSAAGGAPAPQGPAAGRRWRSEMAPRFSEPQDALALPAPRAAARGGLAPGGAVAAAAVDLCCIAPADVLEARAPAPALQ